MSEDVPGQTIMELLESGLIQGTTALSLVAPEQQEGVFAEEAEVSHEVS